MKRTVFITILFLIGINAIGNASDLKDYPLESALNFVKHDFKGRDVDYFLLQDDSETDWTIFVDAEPMKGWSHECYLYKVNKDEEGNIVGGETFIVESPLIDVLDPSIGIIVDPIIGGALPSLV